MAARPAVQEQNRFSVAMAVFLIIKAVKRVFGDLDISGCKGRAVGMAKHRTYSGDWI